MTDDDYPNLTLGPRSAAPDLRGQDDEAAATLMVRWFRQNYEDPAEETPWDDGEYVFIWGGPYDAREELDDMFSAVASQAALDTAVARIEIDGHEWAPSGGRIIKDTQ